MTEFTSFFIASLKEAFHNMFELVIFNVLWLFCSILVITAPPATAALFYTTNQLAHERRANWRTFFYAMRRYFWKSWGWGILNIAIATIFFSNLVFYSNIQQTWAEWAQGGITAIFIFWVILQLFVFPIAFEQDDPNLRTAMRNSAVLMIKRPWFYFGTATSILLLSWLASLLVKVLWGILLAAIIAFLVNRTTIHLVDDLVGRRSNA